MKEAPLVRKPELGSTADRSTPGSGGRHSQTPFDPPRRSFWKQFWKWTAAFSLVSVAALFAYFKLTAHGQQTEKIFREVAPAAWEAKRNPDLIFDNAHSDVVNILLIGRDVNWVVKKVYDPKRKIWASMQVHDETTPARSDTMLIVSLDRVRRVIHMVSLPRDARVRMPENEYGVRRAKLNAAHAYGGPEMLIKTIHDELGITIHHFAVIRFEGFKKLIDQVGGVEVDVIGALKRDGTRGPLKYDDNWGNLHIDLKPGKQVLDGEKAHSYVRFRMDLEGDPGRIKRQQQVMRALAKKLTQQSFYKIPELIQEIQKQFKTDPGFDLSEIASAAGFAQSIGDPSKIQPLTLFGAYGRSKGSLILNESKNKKLLHYIFGPSFNEAMFLQNSPSTERDEMGEENNSSPGAKAILRRAGVIKGATPEEEARDAERSDSSGVEASESRARLAATEESRAASSSEERPRRRTRRSRREESSSSETSSEHRSTPAPRELSTPAEETSSEPVAEERSSTESPVPVPEGLSTSDSIESPVPESE